MKRTNLLYGSTKVPNFIILLILLAAVPISMHAVKLVNDNRSSAYGLSDPRNPCYPTGCDVRPDGTQVRPNGDLRLADGTIITCGDQTNAKCLGIKAVTIPVEKKQIKWWNPLTWFQL